MPHVFEVSVRRRNDVYDTKNSRLIGVTVPFMAGRALMIVVLMTMIVAVGMAVVVAMIMVFMTCILLLGAV